MTQTTSPRPIETQRAFATREEWLVAAIDSLRPLFAVRAGVAIPAVRVSVGWTSGSRRERSSVIGAAWSKHVVADGVPAIFISPILDDAARVLDVLAHELVHAVDENKSGHKGEFARIAKGIGLTGKMTATTAGPALRPALERLARRLGAYPHARINIDGDVFVPAPTPGNPTPAPIPPTSHPKQSTRMIRVSCDTDGCEARGYTARTTRKWLDAFGAPACPLCGQTMIEG